MQFLDDWSLRHTKLYLVQKLASAMYDRLDYITSLVNTIPIATSARFVLASRQKTDHSRAVDLTSIGIGFTKQSVENCTYLKIIENTVKTKVGQ